MAQKMIHFYLFHCIINPVKKFKQLQSWFPGTHLELLYQDDSFVNAKASNPDCKSSSSKFPDRNEEILNNDDIEVIIKKLGMGSFSDDDENQCVESGLIEAIYVLLEEKEASINELDGAFSVFDQNGDGFIDADELQRVMATLDFKEGMKSEDCKKMIRAFDENGDGRIDFREFKAMLEDAK